MTKTEWERAVRSGHEMVRRQRMTRLTELSIVASFSALVGAVCGFVAALVFAPPWVTRGRW